MHIKKYLEGVIALDAYNIKEEKSTINSLKFYLKKLEKEEEFKLKISRKKEIIKEEINEIENGQTIEKISICESWLLENSHKIDKLLVRLVKKKKMTH